ncbi:MAG TPA: hypothetical protein VM328_04180 [Fimbriimonadaceae bacterium]|nr:hypothetical protein [Fimbriimonadaceae bacterium]
MELSNRAPLLNTGEWAVGSFQKGVYVLDGYLVMRKRSDAPTSITIMGRAGLMLATRSGFFTKP